MTLFNKENDESQSCLQCNNGNQLLADLAVGSINESNTKTKTYRIKNTEWFCEPCDIYCNSHSQYDVHIISQKHKFVLKKIEEEKLNETKEMDENNNLIGLNDSSEKSKNAQSMLNVRARTNFSIAEIAQNPLAIRFNINTVKYLITEDKKKGKFEKFGFYCKACDAYMTGQIQLIMHVKGAKHQYYHPNEIPNYKPSKIFNPSQHKRKSTQSNAEKKQATATTINDSFNSITNNTFTVTNSSNFSNQKQNKNKYFNINQMNNMFVSSPEYYENQKSQQKFYSDCMRTKTNGSVNNFNIANSNYYSAIKNYSSTFANTSQDFSDINEMNHFAYNVLPTQINFNNLTQQQQLYSQQMNIINQRLKQNVNIKPSNNNQNFASLVNSEDISARQKLSPNKSLLSSDQIYPQQYLQYSQTMQNQPHHASYPDTPPSIQYQNVQNKTPPQQQPHLIIQTNGISIPQNQAPLNNVPTYIFSTSANTHFTPSFNIKPKAQLNEQHMIHSFNLNNLTPDNLPYYQNLQQLQQHQLVTNIPHHLQHINHNNNMQQSV